MRFRYNIASLFNLEDSRLSRRMLSLCLLGSLTPLFGADANTLIRMSAKPNDEFRKALMESMGEENILKGTAFAGNGSTFLFAVEAGTVPKLYVDDREAGTMRRVKGWKLWYFRPSLKPEGRTRSITW